MATRIPPMIPFPQAAWRSHLVPDEWEACLEAWIALAQGHISLSSSDFVRISSQDTSLPMFLSSFARETTLSPDISTSLRFVKLRKQCLLLSYRLLDLDTPPELLLTWEFLADISKLYGKGYGQRFTTNVWKRHTPIVEASMTTVKSFLIKELDAGLGGDLKRAEEQLRRLSYLLNASPEASAFFMAGSDFVDALISCYKLMNPPLRQIIVTTAYLCLIGLTEGEKPNFSSLVDQLYSLKGAAETHKTGPTSVNDSLVAELVTVTPIIKQIQQRIEVNGTGSSRAKSVLTVLEGFRKPGANRRQVRRKGKSEKGKGIARDDIDSAGSNERVHIHRMSLISQVQDLFPDLGSGFVVKLLDEYSDNVEQVIAHLLEGSLPAHLDRADRSETLGLLPNAVNLAPRSTPPQLPVRRNIFDDDEFDQLAIDTAKLHFGRRNPEETADDILQDRSNAPNKAAILSALAAFDSDDDERDDTYDIADVGGTVDSAASGNNQEETGASAHDGNEETLFRIYKLNPKAFGRDAETRRGKERLALREETSMTDEAIEGWAIMLSRDPRRMRRLEAKFSTFSGGQRDLAPTAWRASPAGSGTEDSDMDGYNRGRGGRLLARERGEGRGRGSAPGPSGDKDTDAARRRKEANKGSSANHNRKAQNAKKMARGGFVG